MRLVLFDLDNTLLAGDSDYEWGQSLIDRGVVDRAHHEARNQAVYEDYKAGRLDIYAFLNFSLRPLATHTRAQLDAWHAEYKITRLEQFLDHHGTRLDCLTSRRFYSDSLNDLPLLEKGQHPIAVDPTLRVHAAAHGWPVISLRDNAFPFDPAAKAA